MASLELPSERWKETGMDGRTGTWMSLIWLVVCLTIWHYSHPVLSSYLWRPYRISGEGQPFEEMLEPSCATNTITHTQTGERSRSGGSASSSLYLSLSLSVCITIYLSVLVLCILVRSVCARAQLPAASMATRSTTCA